MRALNDRFKGHVSVYTYNEHFEVFECSLSVIWMLHETDETLPNLVPITYTHAYKRRAYSDSTITTHVLAIV